MVAIQMHSALCEGKSHQKLISQLFQLPNDCIVRYLAVWRKLAKDRGKRRVDIEERFIWKCREWNHVPGFAMVREPGARPQLPLPQLQSNIHSLWLGKPY